MRQEENDLYLQTALKAGQIALGNGSETVRCEGIMKNILSSSGETDFDTSVVSTSIFARIGQKVGMTTINKWGTDLNKLCQANDVSMDLSAGKLTIKEASDKLNLIDHTKQYGFFIRMLAYVLMMAATPLLINGSAFDCVSAAFCGVVMSIVDAGFQHIQMHSFSVYAIKALVMVICATLAAVVFRGMVNINNIVIASLIHILPGLALTNAVRDTLQGDYVSGASRLLEAVVRAMAFSLGVIVGLVGISMIPALRDSLIFISDPLVFEGALRYLVGIVAALFFSAGFCVIFEVPVRLIIPGSIIGCMGKLFFIYLTGEEAGSVFSTFCAAVLVAALSQICARYMKAPTIPFLISGIMALVPGSSLYYSILNIVIKEYKAGAVKLLDTILIAGAIAIAIFLVDTVFQMIDKARKKELFY